MPHLFAVSIILNEGISPLMMRQKMHEDMMNKARKEREEETPGRGESMGRIGEGGVLLHLHS